MPEHAKPSEFVNVDVSEARTARIWSNVSQRLSARRRSPWLWGAAVAACAAGLALLLIRPNASRDGDAMVVAPQVTLLAMQQERSLVLAEGSQIKLAPHTEVFVAKHEVKALELDLKDGAVTCDVAPVPGRRFVIRAADVKVMVVGTRFSVSSRAHLEARDVSVEVERGIVDVHAGGRVKRLTAGQRWVNTDPVASSEGDERAAVEATQPTAAARDHSSSPLTLPTANGSAAAAESPETADARKLLERANRAQRAGDTRASASAYEELLRRYPKDGRAGVAAFELGRLRMDQLGDTAGAISALTRATSSTGGSVREDAMARLVRAYAATGELNQCQRARQDYERRYPEGLHRAEVRTACGPR
jgi:transmembrane sensor